MYMELAMYLLIMITVISVLSSCFVIRRVKKQIREMSDTLEDIKNGNGNRRILSETHEIVAPLVYEINEIIVSYENRSTEFRQTEETNRQLMTSLSHDVRTPLTTLIGYLDAAHKGIVTGKERDDYIETARRKAHDLKDYIDVLFDWFKLNSNEFAMDIKIIEAAEKSDLTHIFERLYKCDKGRSEKGSGLGLAITHQLVEKMNGSISVESTQGKGTTFTLLFPLTD